MSFQAMTWALRQHVPDGEGIKGSSAKFVLVLLANYADKDGLTFVEAARIGREAELSERVVRRAFEHLSVNELMEYAGFRKGDSGRAKGWRLAMRGADTVSEPSAAPSVAAGQEGADTVSGKKLDTVSAPAPGGPDIRESMSGHGVTGPPIPPQQEVDVLREPEPKENLRASGARAPQRPDDPLIEALCIHAEGSPKGSRAMAESRVRTVAVVAAKIRPLGATPEDVPARVANWPTHFPGASLTAPGVCEHWHRLARPGPHGAPEGGVDWSRYDDDAEVPA